MKERVLLPDWFKGETFKQWEIVTNSLTGDSCELNAIELSIYNSIINIEDKMKNKKVSVKEADLLSDGLILYLLEIKRLDALK